jgi:hypothetical protein
MSDLFKGWCSKIIVATRWRQAHPLRFSGSETHQNFSEHLFVAGLDQPYILGNIGLHKTFLTQNIVFFSFLHFLKSLNEFIGKYSARPLLGSRFGQNVPRRLVIAPIRPEYKPEVLPEPAERSGSRLTPAVQTAHLYP